MSNLKNRYGEIYRHKAFYVQVATGILLFSLSLYFNYYTNNYTANHGIASVHDIILDNIPAKNVEAVFLEGFMVIIALVAALGLHKPKTIPFILKASALFICIRAFFTILTHLAPPLHQSIVNSTNFLEHLLSGSGDDLFFSGHTGYPFLMALVFWENKYWRMFFLAAAIFFGGAVLLGHLHYSIDVFSAFFISYGIFQIAVRLFKKDYKMFLGG